MPTVATDDGTAAAGPRSGSSRWLMLSGLLVLGIVLAFVGWWLVRTDALAASEHQRNIHEVDIAARLIEQWPVSVKAMATGSLLPSRVARTVPADADAGWPHAARFLHPTLGKIHIDYGLPHNDRCPAPEADVPVPAGATSYVAFRDAVPRMIIAGRLAVADLWYADQYLRKPAKTVRGFVAARDAPGFLRAVVGPLAGAAATSKIVCFKTSLLLDRVVDLATAAPEIEKLLLVGRSGKLLAQLGGAPLPMANVRELAPLRPAIELDQLVTVAESSLNGGKPVAVPQKPAESDASDRSAPVRVTVGGRRYFAYSRTLNLPAGFPAIECGDPLRDGATTGETPAGGAASGRIAAAQTCLITGLVPTQTVTAASLQLPPAVLTGFGLVLALVVALLPVLKLRLIGGSDSLRRVEVMAIAFGSIAAVAIATLALLSVAALFDDQRAALGRAERVATAMAADFSFEMTRMLNLPVQFEPLDKTGKPGLAAIDPEAVGVACKQPNAPAVTASKSPAPANILADDSDGRWPLREASLLFGESGAAWPGFKPIYNHCDGGGRTNIGDRPYFQRAMAGDSDGAPPHERAPSPGVAFDTHYVIAAVRSYPDGIEKAIVATPFRSLKADGPRHGALIESFLPRAFVAPVLPARMRFIVVDAGVPALPVLFGSDASRIDVDRLIDDIPSRRARATVADIRCPASIAPPDRLTCSKRTSSFYARYEGVPQRFVAHGLAGTPWVLLVYYPDDAVASPIASVAGLAAGAWSGVALVAALGLIGISALWLHRRLWQWAWPRPGGAVEYRKALRRVGVGSGIAVAAYAVLLVVPVPAAGPLRLVVALVATVAIVVAAARQLSRQGPPESARRFLDPTDERAFRYLAIALLLVVGAGPIIALWCDARMSTFATTDASRSAIVTESIEANVRGHRAIMAAFGTLDDVEPGAGRSAPSLPRPGLYARETPDAHAVPDIDRAWQQGSVTAKLHDWSFGRSPAAVLSCQSPSKLGLRGAAMAAFCARTSAAVDSSSDGSDMAAVGVFVIALLAVGLAILLLKMLDTVLRGLFGHGVALEAVLYPGIRRGGDGRLKLPIKALVLNAPLALRLELLESWQLIDVSDPAGVDDPSSASHVLVTGLALALRDPDLRIKALELLERLARRVDVANRADGRPATTLPAGTMPQETGSTPRLVQLIVMTDLSPLDRVLQAYETEQSLAGIDRDQHAEDGRREQLRWSRLFEAFATIGFRPVTKVSAWTAAGLGDDLTADERRGIAMLVEEVRELPEVVIDSLIDTPEGRIAAYWKRHTRTRGYPFDSGLYHALYDRRVRLWARSVRPASAAAAIDYLRGTLIEHYLFAWIASSHVERIILDGLARGRTVNIATSFALRALVRRGLIRLSPIPQLINRSFAAFVVQAEKPMQIQAWRDEQPRSPWQRASLPLLTILPLIVILFAALASSAGDSAIGLLPLLLGTMPALVGTLTGSRKSN